MVENATKTAVEFPCTSDDACLDNSPVELAYTVE